MLLAHLADLHLGYRAYHRLGPGGVNARERDVARAFQHAVDRLVGIRPDLVVVAGDVFHAVRPSNSAIADAFRQFARLSALLGDVPILVIAGNHDSPRSVETGSILRLLAEIPNIVVVDADARSVYLESLDTSVLCLPHNALASAPQIAMQPDRSAATNLLMLHGTITGGGAEQKLRYSSEYGGVLVDTSEIRPEQWDYVALGHYHIATQLADNMWYSGSMERTSTNIWAEAAVDKGFVMFDTETRRAAFETVPTRPVVDLPRISALGRSAAELDAGIRDRIADVPGGIADKLVRIVITDITRELFRDLDHRRLREYRAEALHFHVDPRRPEVRRVVGFGVPGQRRTLDEEMVEFLEQHWTAAAPQVRTERLVELARQYLAEAGTAPADEPLIEFGAPS